VENATLKQPTNTTVKAIRLRSLVEATEATSVIKLTRKGWKISSNPFYLCKRLMKKFRLSKNISLSELDVTSFEEIPHIYRQGYYILHDAKRDTEYLINASVQYFLNKFSTERTLSEILNEIAVEINSSPDVIEGTVSSFFDFARKRKILVEAGKKEMDEEQQELYKAGDSINEYCIAEVMHNSSYTELYVVGDISSKERFVIKLLNRNKVDNPDKYEAEVNDLKREYQLLQKTKGIDAVSRAYSFEKEQQGNAFILLEYICGKSLSRFLREAEDLRHEDSIKFIKEILRAFAALHERNLVHGDIHAGNVLIDENKKVRIIDLGLTRDTTAEKNQLLPFGGVNFYMPPERISITTIGKFSKEPDLYSDVYQIGILMYLVLYNSLPFKGFIWEELAANIKQETVQLSPRSFLNHPVDNGLLKVINKCLDKEPLNRYANAGEVLGDFEKVFSKKLVLIE
jgi:predicted Ser/Thr protein kinase